MDTVTHAAVRAMYQSVILICETARSSSLLVLPPKAEKDVTWPYDGHHPFIPTNVVSCRPSPIYLHGIFVRPATKSSRAVFIGCTLQAHRSRKQDNFIWKEAHAGLSRQIWADGIGACKVICVRLATKPQRVLLISKRVCRCCLRWDKADLMWYSSA